MDVKELTNKELSRELEITITAATLAQQVDTRVAEIQPTAQLKGFRPGKVPASYLKKTYGQQIMAELVQQSVSSESQKAIEERKERPAMQPEIELVGEAEAIINGTADLVFKMAYEIIPEIKLTDFSALTVKRPKVEIGATEVDEAMARLAESRVTYKPRGATAKARDKDSVKIDFLGKIDGEAFDGGAAEGFDLVLGSGQFIPGFEEQLIGTKAKDELDVKVTFPKDYGSENLAGKDAVFSVTVHEVAAPQEAKLDDEFAKTIGFDDLEKLRDAVEGQIRGDYDQMARAHLKKHVLDQLSETHDFALPPKMIEVEFEQIWNQFQQELAQENKQITDLDRSEDELRAEYQSLAARRVRTGLVLAEVGMVNDIQVSNEELNQGLIERLRQFPGQEQQAMEYFQKNPEAMAQIRAPIFEEKTIDFICEKATIEDVEMDIETLMAGPVDEADQRPTKKESAKKKPAKKATAKKAPAKKAATKKKSTKEGESGTKSD